MTHQATKDLDIPIWRSKLTFATKIRLYNTFVLHVLMYGSEAWTMTASDSAKLDACDQSCLRKICGVHWSQHVTITEIRRRTGQLPVSKLIAKRRLELFGHIARSDPASDTRRAVAATAPRDWRRPRGRPRNTWRSTMETLRMMWPRSTVACTSHDAGRENRTQGQNFLENCNSSCQATVA